MRRRIDVAAGIAALALAALAASAAAVAGTASGTFGVRIALNGPGSSGPAAGSQAVCISESLSTKPGAAVRVSCTTSRFVSFDYYLRQVPGLVEPDAGASAGSGGMITYYRVYSIDEAGGPLHMLVSF